MVYGYATELRMMVQYRYSIPGVYKQMRKKGSDLEHPPSPPPNMLGVGLVGGKGGWR